MALAAKLLFTIFTFGIKVPSGLFVPSLAMGAISGRLMGIKIEALYYTIQVQELKKNLIENLLSKIRHSMSFGNVKSERIVLCPAYMPWWELLLFWEELQGKNSYFKIFIKIFRMTVSLVVIMFELTGSLEFIVPTMAAVKNFY